MNKDIHILFGLRIKELRVRAHISQEELSFRSGLSKNYIPSKSYRLILESLVMLVLEPSYQNMIKKILKVKEV